MTKEQLEEQIRQYGDATVTYRSPKSQKVKYNVCTLDFDNPYIATKQNRAKETDDTLLMFCWDIDSFRLMKFDNVTSVTPMIPSAMKGGKRHGK